MSAGLGGAHPTPLFSPPSGPGRAAAVRGGGGVPLPWQGCARRAHSSPGWERPGDTRRGVMGAAERGGERVRTREESRTRRSRASGVGMGSLESAPATPRSPAMSRSSPLTLAGVQAPKPRFWGRDPNYRPRRSFGFLRGLVRRAKCPSPTPQAELQPRLRPEALQLSPSPSPAPPAGPLPGRACTANYSMRAAADYSGVQEAAGVGTSAGPGGGVPGAVPGQGSFTGALGCGPLAQRLRSRQ